MQIQMSAEELAKGLYRAQGIVDRKATMPILANVLLEASEGLLAISATDLELGLKGEHPVEVGKPGKITVPARSLLDIVRSLPEKTVTLTRKQNNWVEIVSGRYRSRLVGADPADFPDLPGVEDVSFVNVEAEALSEMIEKTHFAVSTDETRYNLNGVFIEAQGATARMVATDGHRLSMVERELGGKLFLSKGVIIPRKGLSEMRRLLGEKPGTVSLGFSGSNAVFRSEGLYLVMRLVDGQFPDYQQVIPDSGKHPLTVDREALLSTLKRVSLVSPDRAPSVKLELGKSTLTVISENPDLGEASEALEVGYDGPEVKVGFNAKYLIEVLGVLGSERVILEVADELSPGLVKAEDDPGFTAVVMPMRI
ncbi:MAG: DNA polymerase III subunit beta [Deltaproteobacteria bacterium]|nr:DNA polymerase III subunit beta [Deltaproteobacteria bacterium]